MRKDLNTNLHYLAALLAALVTGCATHTTAPKAKVSSAPRAASPAPVNPDGSPHFSNMQGLDVNSLDSDYDADDEEDVTDAERVEGTPEDLGEVEFSQKRRADEINADALAAKTFPLVYNEFVDQWVRYFTGRGRATFDRWLKRSTRYIPAMKEVLRKEGLPEDLIYLAMIESGFNPKAASHAKAVGPWQFITGTGKRYDLEIGYWLDERRDFIKSSIAAARYLRELHQIFGSWYLAAASYNAGEGKVLNAIRKDRSRNFWELCRTKKNFRSETRNYVPKIIAAALLAKNPEKYGFTGIDYDHPYQWSFVRVPSGVDLRAVADITNVDPEDLLVLNAELRRGITPPQENGYEIKVPPEKKELLLAKVGELKSQKLNKYFVTHKIRRGETIGAIARRYGSNVQTLLEINDIKRATRLKPGFELSVPVSDRVAKHGDRGHQTPRPSPQRDQSNLAQNRTRLPASVSQKLSTGKAQRGADYVIQAGDTLWKVSQDTGVSVKALKKANRITSSQSLKPGRTLTIPNAAH